MKNFTNFLGRNRSGALRLLLVVVGMVWGGLTQAATYYSIASGNWNATSTWSTVSHAGAAASAVPTSGDIVLIGAHTVTVTADVASSGSRLGSLTFDVSGGTVSVNSSITLWLSTVTVNHIANTDVSATFTGVGTVDVGTSVNIGSDITPATATSKTTSLTIGATSNAIIFNTPTFNLMGDKTSSFNNNCALNLANGTITVSGATAFTTNGFTGVSNTTTCTITNAVAPNSSILKIADASTAVNTNTTVTTTFTFTGTSSTVEYSRAGNQTLYTTSYNNLTLSGSGTKTAVGAISVAGTLTYSSGTTLDMSTYALSGALTPAGTGTLKTACLATPITSGKTWTGIVEYYGAAGQALMAGTYNDLTLTTGQTFTASGSLIVDGTLTISNASGILDLGTANTLTGTLGTVTSSGKIKTACPTATSATPLASGKTWGGTVEYTAAGAQTLMAGTYNNLTLTTGQTFTASGSLIVDGTLTISNASGILDLGTAYTLTGTLGTVTSSGKIKTACPTATSATPLASGKTWGGTVEYTAAGAQTLMAGTYNNLTLTTGQTFTASGSLIVNGTLTISNASGILDLGTANTLTGTLGTVTSSGTIKTACPTATSATPLASGKTWTGTVDYASASAQTLMAGTYTNLVMSGGAQTKTASGNIILAATSTLTLGASTTLDLSTNTLTGGATSFTCSGAGILKTSNTSAAPIMTGKTWTGTVEYAATSGTQTVMAGTYASLTSSNTSGTNTASGAISMTGTLTIASGGTLDMATNALSGALTPSISGTLKTSCTANPSLTSGLTWGGTVEYASASAQTLMAGTYTNLVMSGGAQTKTASGNIILAATSTLTLGTGTTLNLSTYTLTGGATSFTCSGSGTLKTSCTTATSATPIMSGKTWSGTVEYATSSQTVVTGTYNNLTLSNTTGTNTASGAITVNSTLTTAASGIFAIVSYDLTVGDMTGGGTISSSSGTPTLSVGGSNNNCTYSGVIGAGAIALTKTGTGTLTLSGANSYTGATTVSTGVLNIQNATALGTTSAGTTVSSGAALQLQGAAVGAEALSISGTGISTDGVLRFISGTNSWAGLITLTADARINADAGTNSIDVASSNAITGTFNLTFGGNGNLTVADPIATGTGMLTKDGSGALTLSGANTFTGGVSHNAGTLKIGNASALGTTAGTFTIASGTTIDASAASITLSSYPITMNSFTFTGTNSLNLGAGAVTLGSSTTITAVHASNTLTIGGAIGDGASTFNFATAGTAGAIILSGANSYGGTTTVGSGSKLQLGAAGVIPDGSAVTVTGTLNLAGFSELVGSITGAGVIDNSTTTNCTLTCGGDNSDTQFSGVIKNTGFSTPNGKLSVIKSGSGTLTLSGLNTNMGAYTISAGTLKLGVDGTQTSGPLGDCSSGNGGVSVASGATLDFNGSSLSSSTARSITINGTGVSSNGAITNSSSTAVSFDNGIVLGAASEIETTSGNISMTGTIDNGGFLLTVDGSNAVNIGTGVMSGAGGVTKNGTGTLTVSGAHTFSGAITINNGIYKLGSVGTASASGPLGTNGGGTTVNSGGSLDVNGQTFLTTEAVTINGTGYSSNGAIYNSTGTGTFPGAITLASAATIEDLGTSLTLTGGITNAGFNTTFGGTGTIILPTTGVKITGSGGVIKSDAGILRLSIASDYTGTTTVNAGRLENGASEVFPNNTQLILNGGTYGNALSGASATAYTETFGTLQVTGNSTIDFATTSTTQDIIFAASNALTWSGTLTITDWGGTAGSTGSKGQIFVGSTAVGLTSTQLSYITFSGYDSPASQLSTGEVIAGAFYQYRTSASGSWSSASIWEISANGTTWSAAASAPNSGSGAITVRHDVTFDASISIDETTINASKTLTISNGITMTIANGSGDDVTLNGTLVVNGTVTNNGVLQVNTGGYYNHASGTAIPTGILWGSSGSAGTLEVSGTATCSNVVTVNGTSELYNLKWTSNQAMPTAISGAGSETLCKGDFTFSGGSFTVASSGSSSSSTLTIGGNLLINGGSMTITITTGTQGWGVVNVGGNLTLSSGTLNMSSSGSSSTSDLYVAGDFTHSGGTLSNTSTGTTSKIYFNGGGSTQTWNSSAASTYTKIGFNVNANSVVQISSNIITGSTASTTVNSTGTLILPSGYNFSGVGTFTASSGSTLKIGHTEGIASSGSTGAVQTTTRSFNAGANYYYNGSVAQVTGTGLPASLTATLTIDNSEAIGSNSTGVTLSQATSTSGTVTLTNGILTTTSSNLLTITNTLTTAISSGSTTKYINGPLSWSLPTAASASGGSYLFPVGKGGNYYPYTFSSYTATTPTLTVEAMNSGVTGSTDAPYTMDNSEYWKVIFSNNATSAGTVQLGRSASIGATQKIGMSTTVSGYFNSLGGTVSGSTITSASSVGTVTNSTQYFAIMASGSCGTYSGTMTVGTGGTFSTLYQAINSLKNCGYSGNIVLELNASYDGTSSTEIFPLDFTGLGSSTKTITIRPASGVSGRTISGSNATAIFDLLGADYITVDGRAGGTGSTSVLTISNTNTAGNVFRFTNGSTYNTVQYCTVNSAASSTVATVLFGTSSTAGNSNNTIDNCIIAPASGTQKYGIESTGSASYVNTSNTISNCEIKDFATHGIYVNTYSSTFSISKNHLYQTAAIGSTSASSQDHSLIYLNSGDGYSILNNYLGGTAKSCAGSPFVVNNNSSGTNNLYGIYLGSVTGSNQILISNNLISNFENDEIDNSQKVGGIYLSCSEIKIKIDKNIIKNIYTFLQNGANVQSFSSFAILSNRASTYNGVELTITRNKFFNLYMNDTRNACEFRFVDLGSLTSSGTITPKVYFVNNYIANSSTNLITYALTLGSSTSYVYSNTFDITRTGTYGFSVISTGNSSTNYIYNNLIKANSDNYTLISIGTSATIYHDNNYYNLASGASQATGKTNWETSGGTQPTSCYSNLAGKSSTTAANIVILEGGQPTGNDVTSSPSLISAMGKDLYSSSNSIYTGQTAGFAVTDDIEGNARPNGSAPDIGCYQGVTSNTFFYSRYTASNSLDRPAQTISNWNNNRRGLVFPGSITGTIGSTPTQYTINGSGTEFLNDFRVGDQITVNSATPTTFNITNVYSNTQMVQGANNNKSAATYTNASYSLSSPANFTTSGYSFIIQSGHQYKTTANWDASSSNTSGYIEVEDGGSLNLGAFSILNFASIKLSGSGVSSRGALFNSAATTLTRPIVLKANSTIGGASGSGLLTLNGTGGITGTGYELTIAGSNDITLSTGINTSTSGSLIKNGSGTFTLSGSGNYTGNTTINVGVINIQNATALGTIAGSVSVSNGAALQIQGAVVGAKPLAINGNGVSSDGALRFISGTNSWAGTVTLGSATRINADAGTNTISGSITGTGLGLTIGGAGDLTLSGGVNTSTSGTLTKDGAGILTLSGTSNYTGSSILSNGTITLGVANALPVSASAGVIQTTTTSGVTLNLGLFDLGSSTASANSAGKLDFDVNTTVNLGASGTNSYYFKASNDQTWSGTTITINNWTGTAGVSGTGPKIYVGSDTTGLTSTQLAKISFSGYTCGSKLLSTGELVPKSAPTLSSTLTPTAICSGTAFTYTPTSATSGATFTWTRAAVTNISNAAITTAQSSNPNETLTNTGNTQVSVVYAYTTTSSGCSSTQNVTVAVNPLPTISGTTPASRCDAGTVGLGATASAGTINWYAASTGGVSLGTGTSYTTPSISTTTTYYVDATSNSCTTGSRTAVVATVNTTPTISGTTPASRCDAGTVGLGATASAGTINWYAASTGGVSLGTGTSYTTPSISTTTTYYVDATSNSCTTGSRTAVVATVNTTPTISGTTPASRCDAGTVGLGATASAGTINWYAASTGGVSLGTGTSYTTPSISTTTTYYVDATSNSCTTGSRTAVVATVNTTPTISGTTPASRCDAGTVGLGATASAGTINWYAASTGGVSLGTGTSYTTPSISITTTYYVDATSNSCTTGSRTAVVATVNSSVAGTAASDQGIAYNTTAGLTLTGSTGSIQWQESANGSTGWANVTGGTGGTTASYTTANLTADNYYRAVVTNGSCTSATSNTVTITITTSPTISTSTSALTAFSACAGSNSSNQTFTVSGSNLTANISISSPTGYEISTASGSGFGSSLTLTQASGSVSLTTIYVRTTTGASNGASGNISATSAGATTKNVATGTATISSNPTTSNAGTAIDQCNTSAFTLAGNSPTTGTGLWTVTSGTATITTPSSATSGVTGITAGNSATLTWTISNGACTASTSTVTLTNYASPTTSNAGTAIDQCNTSAFTLAGNSPSTGTGLWTVTSGSATITTPSSATSGVTGITAGNSATLTWTISNGACSASTSTVTLTNYATTVAGTAASSQSIVSGNSPVDISLSGNTGTIQWEYSDNNSSYSSIGSATSATLSSATMGTLTATRYYRAVVTNGVCSSATSNVVTITVTSANATITLAANTISSASPCASTTKVPIQSFSLAVTNGTGNLTNVGFTTTGTYAQADISKYQLWCSSTNSIGNAVQLSSDLSSSGAAGSRTFSAFTSPALNSGSTYYFWITADIAASPTNNVTLAVDAITTSNLTTTSNTAGTTSAGGTQTLKAAPTTSNAGADQTSTATCGVTLATLGANNPTVGTGAWSIQAGSGGSITSASTYNTTFTGTLGNSYTLRWSISNGACAASTDDVVITFNAPMTTTPANGDYVWRGTDNSWSTLSNWLSHNGTSYSVAGSAPTSSNRVIISAANNCATTHPTLTADISVGSLIIESGASLNQSTYTITVNGDFNNSGTFTAGTGTTTFTGTGTITGATSFYNLTINGATTFASSHVVDNTLTLGNKITLGANNLTIGSSGSISGYSASNFIVTNSTGKVIQNGLGAGAATGKKIFPVGISSSSYTPISVDNTGTSDNFSVYVGNHRLANGSSGGASIMHAVDRTWFVEEASVGNSNVTLTIQWNASEELAPTGNAFNRLNCFISHYTGGAWDSGSQTGGSATAGTEANSYKISRSGITSFSPFAVEDPQALPITLIDFTAKVEGKKVRLDWETGTEENNDYFTIERSLDGKTFEKVFTKDGAGNSKTNLYYFGYDASPYTGVSYYRLKQTDFDGKFAYSDIVSVKVVGDQMASEMDVQVYPNPVTNQLIHVDVNAQNSGTYSMHMINEIGQQVFEDSYEVVSGENKFELQLPMVVSGIYMLEIRNNNDVLINRVKVTITSNQ